MRLVIAPPEPDLTAAEMVARAEALRPVLRERQPATEAAGRLLDETHQDFLRAGFYRALQPRRFGGYELPLRDFVRVMSEVARGCPSSGWVLALTAGHPFLLAQFPERAQAEVYGADGDMRLPGRPIPTAGAVPQDGGFAVSGFWDYASGCDHATHFVGTAAVAESGDPPRLIFAIVDRADFTIVDNWDVIGLRGTGSKRVVCEGVFVPEHRTITLPGTTPEPSPGIGTHENPLYSGGFFTLLFFELGAIAVGMARGAIDAYEEILKAKRVDIPPQSMRGELPEYQLNLGRSIGLVDLAEAALFEGTERWLDQARRAVAAGEPVDHVGEESRRIVLLQQQIVGICGDVANLIFRTAGTSGARAGSPIANAMLALSVMRTHQGLQWERTMQNVARQRLGLEPGFL